MIWSSLVVSWFFFGFSLVFCTTEIGKVQGKEILIKVCVLKTIIDNFNQQLISISF